MKKKIFIILAILILPICMLVTPVYAFGPTNNEIYEGIDVSAYQENIDYEQVRNDGIEIVYIKSSEGSNFVDPYFEQNYTKAKANNLRVGFYHYLTARSAEEAIVQANFFVSTISNKQADCKLAMDFESFGNLSVEEINAIGLAFLQTVERISQKETIIYSDTNNATTVFGGELTEYPLWVAQYEVEQPTPNGRWEEWTGWQYTDMGQIAGISTYVDRDKFTSNIFLSNTTQIPLPEGNNKPSAGGTTTIIIRYGQTLSGIARQYNTTVQRLVELNNIQNPNLIYAGRTLIVPSGETPSTSDGNSTSGDEIYIVQAGNTLSQIAEQYGLTVQAIASPNGIRNVNLIYVDQRLIIPTNRYDMNHILYRVKRGDTLWAISRRYGVSISTIVRLNRIQNPNLIYAGQTLRI